MRGAMAGLLNQTTTPVLQYEPEDAASCSSDEAGDDDDDGVWDFPVENREKLSVSTLNKLGFVNDVEGCLVFWRLVSLHGDDDQGPLSEYVNRANAGMQQLFGDRIHDLATKGATSRKAASILVAEGSDDQMSQAEWREFEVIVRNAVEGKVPEEGREAQCRALLKMA
jgi:hypothetical protein